jgi:hypothetical protein
MADIVNSLFGIDPAALQQQRALTDQAAALQFAGLDDLQRAQYGIALGARGIGRGITQLMGGDEQLNKATKVRQLASQFDMTSAEGIGQFAQAVSSFAPEVAQAAIKRRDDMRLTSANIFQKSGENINTLISSGKFTPESLAVYKQSRNPADLELVEKGLSNTNKEKVAGAVEANTMLEFGISEIGNYRDMIKKGEVQYGPLTNLTARASAAIGSPTANALKQQEIESFLISQINEVLNAAKGVQAKDDALRAERQIKTYLAANSNDGMDKALELLEKTKRNVKKGNEAYINSLTGETATKKPTTPATQGSTKNIYNVVRSRQGWTDATDAEIETAIKAGKIKVPTGK